MISSVSNPQIKNVIALQKKAKARREQGLFVVEGIKMVEEAKNNHLVKAYISEQYFNELTKRKEEVLKNLDYEVVTDSVFKQMSDTITPQGILATVTLPTYELKDLLDTKNGQFVLLEDLRDPGNLGTIMRTAEGAGVTAVILSKESVDLFNPKVIRSTMGSIFRMPFVYVDDFIETLEQMKQKGITLCAAHLKGKNNYDQEDYTVSCGILIGNEANGLSDEASKEAQVLVKIPMCGQVESLNAAVACSIFMYEVARQRRNN